MDDEGTVAVPRAAWEETQALLRVQSLALEEIVRVISRLNDVEGTALRLRFGRHLLDEETKVGRHLLKRLRFD